MRRVMKGLVLAAAVLVVSAPAKARAEGYLNPWAGVIFGSDAEEKKGLRSFGVSAGDTGNGLGLDVNVGYSPKPFEGSDVSVLDVMAGVTLGPQLGRGERTVRPYAVGGVGLLRTSVESSSSNDFGFNVGGGFFAYFSTRFGIRGELRYYRTINGDELGDFDFMRAQFGIVIR